MTAIRIGTRGSVLALAQANWVKQRIEARYPDADVQIAVVKTSGDRFVEAPMQILRGKGVFTKEIEDALLAQKIDLAVHSMKDLPPELPPGLMIAAIPEREDPSDVLVSRGALHLRDLPAGGKIGTGSLRRKAQILHHRSDLRVVPLKGNIDTRLRKLDREEVDAVILAAAGLKRIGREHRIVEYLSAEVCMSAAAQGALGLECRAKDPIREQISFLQHSGTFAEVVAERSFLTTLGAGCHVPVGARAKVAGDSLHLTGVVAHPDGSVLYRDETTGAPGKAVQLGRDLAARLLRKGAGSVLALPAGPG
ncbi:MAG TPA: hydroxymethylbilane synthase [Candidatus Binatia bacterium]|nr:hydroxymethylbilane synthase [Candidatus Binatia bacterium]